jgi:hypothetical protein
MSTAYSAETRPDNMFIVLGRFLRWIFEKFAAATLIVVLALAAGGLWLFLRDNVDFDLWRQDVLRAINGQRAETRSALADVHLRMDRIAAEITAEQDRGAQAERVIAQLKDLESTWDRFFGNREQQQANAEQIKRMSGLRADITAKLQALQRDFTRATWERDGLEIALGKLDAQFKAAEANQSRVLHYLERAWNTRFGREPFRWPVKGWVGLFFSAISSDRASASSRCTISWHRLSRAAGLCGWRTRCLVCRKSARARWRSRSVLAPGDRLWIKEQFLQASDEGLAKRHPLRPRLANTAHLPDCRAGGVG